MGTLGRFKSLVLKNGYRLLTMLEFGPKTAYNLAPFGDDSHPTKDMVGVILGTSESGENFVAGFMNLNQITEIGEKRIFSVKENGDLATHVYLKKDGTIQIGVDATDNAVRYSELEKSYNALRSDLNDFIAKYNTHVHTGHGVPTTSTATPSSSTITAAKVNEINVP